jgi:hypothetical protein
VTEYARTNSTASALTCVKEKPEQRNLPGAARELTNGSDLRGMDPLSAPIVRLRTSWRFE